MASAYPESGAEPRHHIVVVDDEPSNADLTRILLEMEGYQVSTAGNIQGALSATTADTAAFIIDFHLVGGATGLTLLEAIRAGRTAANPNAAVIFLSGDFRGRDLVLAAGADEFLMKPFTPRLLHDTLLHLLSRDQ